MWEAIREEQARVEWWKAGVVFLCFPTVGSSQKLSLNTWNRLLKWAYKGKVKCLFYTNIIECTDHTFSFKCIFCKRK